MEINETTVLDDRGFVKINGDEAKSFLQNIVTNDIEKITDSLTLFSSIFTPQGKYLYEFFILKFEDGYLLECEKKVTSEIIKIFNFYKLRAKVNLIDVSKKYTNIIISLEKFKEITKTQHMEDSTLSCEEGSTLSCENERIYVDPRSKNLGAKIITKIENIENIILSIEEQINSLKKLIQYNEKKIDFNDSDVINNLKKITAPTFFGTQTAYNTSVSSGRLNFSKDMSVSNEISLLYEHFYKRLDANSQIYDLRNTKLKSDYFMEFFQVTVGKQEINDSIKSVFFSTKTRNALYWILEFVENFYIYRLKDTRNQMLKTEQLISEFLHQQI